MFRRWVALFVGAALVVTASAVGISTAGASRPAAQSYDKILKTSIQDIQDFWSEQMPAVYGVRYSVLPASHIHAYTAKTDMSSITECARGGATYKDFKHNAFHCPLDMTVNYDNQDLFPGLYKKFGAFALAQVLSHEWGHVIQTQTGTEFPATVPAEQQADCFAGAYATLRPVHVESADDRRAAVSSALDVAQGGDLPFKDVLPTTKQDLDLYWGQFTFGGQPYQSVSDVISYNARDKKSLPKCNSQNLKASDYNDTIFYCDGENYIAYDRDLIRGVYGEIGDFGVSVLIGNAWASAMQSRLGISGDTKEVGLQADCFSGAWVGSVPVDREGTVQARGAAETAPDSVRPLTRRPRRGRAVLPRVR